MAATLEQRNQLGTHLPRALPHFVSRLVGHHGEMEPVRVGTEIQRTSPSRLLLGLPAGGKVQMEEASAWMAHSLVRSFIQQAFIEGCLHARAGAKG